MLLILAGVSISLILDNNGIIKKSKDARREYRQAQTNEQEDLSNLSDMIDEATAEPTPKVNVNTKAGDNSTINGKKGNSNNPTIPKNYIPIDTATSTWGDGSTAPSQDSVKHGLVIKDEKNNEWVWVPVDSATLATMYEESSDEKTLCGTTGETAVKTKLYSKSITIGTDSNKKTISRITPGTSSNYREPDLVVKNSNGNDDYDAKEEYYKTILGFKSKEKMAEAFVAEYKEMIESIRKYGGFYIGRYELSEAGVKKNQPTLTNTNWYNLYKKCKSLNASEKVKTEMIWGCQWDVTCNFIANKGDKKDITNASSWGNYFTSTGNAKVVVTENGTETKKYGSKQNTGYSEYWKANNIYDLAGNCMESTQETNSTSYRVSRGGYYGDFGSSYAAFNCGYPYNDNDSYRSSRRFSSHFNNKVALNSRA